MKVADAMNKVQAAYPTWLFSKLAVDNNSDGSQQLVVCLLDPTPGSNQRLDATIDVRTGETWIYTYSRFKLETNDQTTTDPQAPEHSK